MVCNQFKLTSIIALVLFACTNTTEVQDSLSLEEIYLSKSLILYEKYLHQWQSVSVPITGGEFNFLSDTIQSVYRIYQAFYNPFELERYCTSGRCPEFGTDFYQGLNTIIAQGTIKYSLQEYEDHIVIENFRPDIKIDGAVLFLTEHYRTELDSFLNRERYPDQIHDRINFLNQKLKIIPGHWFGWHYLTHPEVSIIYLNSTLDSATIHFRIIYEGGEANIVRRADKWEMTDARLTWIE